MHFNESIERALRTAFQAHEGQTRKGSATPYVSHPVHVALLVARAGGDDIAIQAALLHDVVEDCEGWELEHIEEHFGIEVAAVVAPLTEVKGPAWEERKRAAREHVPTMCERAAAVKAADKTHNMRSLVERLAGSESPEEAWAPFSRGPEQTIDEAEKLVDALEARLEALDAYASLRRDLRAAFEELRKFR